MHTPSVEEVRKVWGLAVPQDRRAERDAGFDRMIAGERRRALQKVLDALTPPYNVELRPDGSEDPEVAQMVAFAQDACGVVRDLMREDEDGTRETVA